MNNEERFLLMALVGLHEKQLGPIVDQEKSDRRGRDIAALESAKRLDAAAEAMKNENAALKAKVKALELAAKVVE